MWIDSPDWASRDRDFKRHGIDHTEMRTNSRRKVLSDHMPIPGHRNPNSHAWAHSTKILTYGFEPESRLSRRNLQKSAISFDSTIRMSNSWKFRIPRVPRVQSSITGNRDSIANCMRRSRNGEIGLQDLGSLHVGALALVIAHLDAQGSHQRCEHKVQRDQEEPHGCRSLSGAQAWQRCETRI